MDIPKLNVNYSNWTVYTNRDKNTNAAFTINGNYGGAQGSGSTSLEVDGKTMDVKVVWNNISNIFVPKIIYDGVTYGGGVGVCARRNDNFWNNYSYIQTNTMVFVI